MTLLGEVTVQNQGGRVWDWSQQISLRYSKQSTPFSIGFDYQSRAQKRDGRTERIWKLLVKMVLHLINDIYKLDHYIFVSFVGFKDFYEGQWLRARLCCRKISDSSYFGYIILPHVDWLAQCLAQRRSIRNMQRKDRNR